MCVLSVQMRAPVMTCVDVREQTLELILSFHYVGFKDWTQVVRLHQKYPYWLNYLLSPLKWQ